MKCEMCGVDVTWWHPEYDLTRVPTHVDVEESIRRKGNHYPRVDVRRLLAAGPVHGSACALHPQAKISTVGGVVNCRNEYVRPGGREPGDRIVRCGLPAGHDGEHEEADTEVTWPNQITMYRDDEDLIARWHEAVKSGRVILLDSNARMTRRWWHRFTRRHFGAP